MQDPACANGTSTRCRLVIWVQLPAVVDVNYVEMTLINGNTQVQILANRIAALLQKSTQKAAVRYEAVSLVRISNHYNNTLRFSFSSYYLTKPQLLHA